MRRTLLHAATVLFAAWFFMAGTTPPREAPGEFHLDAFGRLPVKFDGRKKPIDTLARNQLTVLSGKQTTKLDGERVSAVKWLLDNLAGRPEALDYPVVRIESIDLLSDLGLEEQNHFRYSYREILPALGRLDAAARSAFGKESARRDLYDRQVIKTANKLYLYQNILSSFEDPRDIPSEQLMATAQRYMQLESYSLPLVVPPTEGNPRWRPLMSALLAGHPSMQAAGHGMEADPLAGRFGGMLAAYREGDAATFNRELDAYVADLRAANPEVLDKLSFEVFYNRLGAFIKAAQVYLLVFVVSCFGWLFRKEAMLAAARTLMVCAFVPHTFAIVARVFLSGYPPITNLYSTAIFIGWGAVASGIIIEYAFRRRAEGIGNLVAGIAGFATLLIAHFLAGDGDTMEQMRAVLDTRFWLATHVITINLGYMATFVAGAIAIFFVLSGLLTRRLDATTRDGMYRMMYGTTCFALLFSFVGTVLGGLWADDSWGRFWGWDPKENGALLIVIWNAIMLHACYGKMVHDRGFAIMAVFGNVVTAWSWFGVNQLGVGLHSYGFTDSASFWLLLFAASQLVICAAGAIPERHWKSRA